MQCGIEIRDLSKSDYKREWLDCRLILISVIRFTQVFRSGIPGKTNESISNRLQLIAQYAQGVGLTETAISEGLYVKANALLKQDYEILTRIREYKAGSAKVGKTPNAKHAPKGSQQFYGDLNSVAHPSNPVLLAALTRQHIDGEVAGVSSSPVYLRETACSHYEFNVWITLEIAREALLLSCEMYDKHEDMMDLSLPFRMFLTAVKSLESVGFEVETSIRE